MLPLTVPGFVGFALRQFAILAVSIFAVAAAQEMLGCKTYGADQAEHFSKLRVAREPCSAGCQTGGPCLEKTLRCPLREGLRAYLPGHFRG